MGFSTAGTVLVLAVGAISCTGGDAGVPVHGTVATVTAALTSDPSNERLEGSFTLALAAGTEGSDNAEVGSFDFMLTGEDGMPVGGVTVASDAVFPIVMKPGTSARVHYTFTADSPLPPPPDLGGWCRDPWFVQPSGTLGGTTDATLYGSPDVFLPSLTVERTAPLQAPDLGAMAPRRIASGAGKVTQGLALDAAGNTLMSLADVTGEFPIPALMTKLDPSGSPLWTRDLFAAGQLFSATVAAGGDVEVMAGSFTGEIDLGDGLVSDGSRGTYVARLGAGGETLWSRQVRVSGGVDVQSIEVDASGNVLLAANAFPGSVQVMIGSQVETIEPDSGAPSAYPYGVLVAFGPGGDYLFGKALPAQVEAFAVDASGSMVLAGHFGGTVDFGGGPLVGSADSLDVWIAKLDAAGQHVWSRWYAGSAIVSALELGPGGEILLTARTAATVDFGGGPLGGAGTSLIVAKLDPEGGHLWSKRFAELNFDADVALAVDDAGRVFLGGSTNGSVQFGAAELPNETELVLYAAQLDPSGEEVRAGFFGCSNGHVPALAYRSGVSPDVVLAATFRRIASLAGEQLATGAIDDVIVARLAP
jgi:hypothetical protein